MDTGTIIVGTILGVIAIMPFVLTSHNRKKARAKLLGLLTKSAKQKNSKITKVEYLTDSIIGIDEYNHYLYMADDNTKEEEVTVVDLKKIRDSSVERVKSSAKVNGKVIEKIERLVMRLNPIGSMKSAEELDFYNIDNNLSIDGELESIEKWNGIVNMQLKVIKL